MKQQPTDTNKRRNINKLLMDQRNNSNWYAHEKLQNDAVGDNRIRMNKSSNRAQSLKRPVFQNNNNSISKYKEERSEPVQQNIRIDHKYQSKSVMGNRRPKRTPKTTLKDAYENSNKQKLIKPNKIDFNQQSTEQMIKYEKKAKINYKIENPSLDIEEEVKELKSDKIHLTEVKEPAQINKAEIEHNIIPFNSSSSLHK